MTQGGDTTATVPYAPFPMAQLPPLPSMVSKTLNFVPRVGRGDGWVREGWRKKQVKYTAPSNADSHDQEGRSVAQWQSIYFA